MEFSERLSELMEEREITAYKLSEVFIPISFLILFFHSRSFFVAICRNYLQ